MQFTPGEINIICSDVQASLHFYCDILGFVPATDDEGFYHLQAGGRQYLLLPIARSASPPDPYGTIPQFSMDLTVENLREAYDYLKSHHVTFALEWAEGESMFVIRDPDGLPWEVLT